jgi:hypothetical protein
METWLVPGAHLELAPVFLLAAVLLAASVRYAVRRRRPSASRLQESPGPR